MRNQQNNQCECLNHNRISDLIYKIGVEAYNQLRAQLNTPETSNWSSRPNLVRHYAKHAWGTCVCSDTNILNNEPDLKRYRVPNDHLGWGGLSAYAQGSVSHINRYINIRGINLDHFNKDDFKRFRSQVGYTDLVKGNNRVSTYYNRFTGILVATSGSRITTFYKKFRGVTSKADYQGIYSEWRKHLDNVMSSDHNWY
ncbi:hypothetical protein [Cysteiniphilum litorale]|uniref:hypothetical protein n=1 Tax=Cysteiniphilum litorale TaxID=2056700 RepID=UPI003F8853FA